MLINATVSVVASGTPLNDALYNGPSGEVPVMVLDFEEGVYAKDVGGGLNVSTFDTLISGGLVEMDEDGIRRLRCDTGDAPTADINNLSLSSATIVVWCQSFDVAGSFERVFQFDDGTENNRITNWYNAGVPPSLLLQMKDGGLQQANFSTNYLLDERAVRMASAWTAGSVAASANGVAAETGGGTETIPTVTTLRLGHGSIAGDELQGGIQRVVIYDTRLSDADLATLSTNNLKFVAATGSDGADGTAGTPWATVDYAINNASAGDTVYVSAGTYDPFETSNGGTDKNNFITICAEPADTPFTAVIDGGGNPLSPGTGGAWKSGIYCEGSSYIRFGGLRVINLTDTAAVGGKPKCIEILAGSTNGTNIIEHIRIGNCETQHSRSSAIYVSGYRLSGQPTTPTTRVDNVRIEGCHCQDHNILDGSNEGISIGGGTINLQIKDCTINNTVQWAGIYRQYGIDLKDGVDGAEIVGNTCYNHLRHGIYLDCAEEWVRNVDIHKNICYGQRNGIVITREGGSTDPGDNPNHEIQNINIYNNILYDNSQRGILLYQHGSDNNTSGKFESIHIYNNTIAGHIGGTTGNNGIEISNMDPIADDIWVANNLFWDNGTSIQLTNMDPLTVNTNNITAGSDPFTNYAGKDFTLASGTSDGVGDANGTYAPADDFDGTARPVGAAYDAGAYERA